MSNNEENICCPEFKPEKWDDKVWEWENKNFVKSEVKHSSICLLISHLLIRKK